MTCKGEKHTLADAGKFLMKRGLKRDRANYVSLLIRFRAEMLALHKGVKDGDVREGLDGMAEILGDEIISMYQLQELDDDSKGKRK